MTITITIKAETHEAAIKVLNALSGVNGSQSITPKSEPKRTEPKRLGRPKKNKA